MRATHLDDFLQSLAVERAASPATLRNYRTDVASLLQYAAERGLNTETIDRECVRCWIGDRAAAVSPGTRRRQLSALRTFFGWLVSHGMRCTDPTIGIRAPSRAHPLPRVLSEGDAKRLIEATTGESFTAVRARAALELLYGAGLRVSELVALDDADVSEARGEVRVRGGKGHKDRMVFVGGAAQQAVRRWRAARQTKLRLLSRRGEPALFINGLDGQRLVTRSIQALVRAAGDRIGIKGLHPHVLRHSFATHLVDRGADLLMVSRLLGHESVSSTQVYTRLATRRLSATIHESHPRG